MFKCFALFFLLFFANSVYSSSNTADYFNKIFEDKSFNSIKIKEFDNYSIYETVSHDTIKHIIFNTKWLPVVTQGFGGPLDVYLLLSTDLAVVDVALSNNSETPWYVDKVFKEKQFAKNFVGFTTKEEVKQVDAITRATYTTEAVIERVALALEFLKGTREFGSSSFNSGFKVGVRDIVTFAVLLVSVFAALFYKKINRKFVLLINLLLFVFLSVRIQLSVGVLASLSGTLSVINLFVVFSLILALFLGRFYCGFVCPFGIIQEFANSLIKNNKLNLIRKKAKDVLRNKIFRVYMFYFVHIGYLLFLVGTAILLSNRQHLFAEILNYYMLITQVYFVLIAAFIVILSVVDSRFYCKFICPTGYVFVIIRNISPFKTKLPKGCTSCLACTKKCPTDAIITQEGKAAIDKNYCIDCKLCLNSCAKV